jgi:acyl dehydratase
VARRAGLPDVFAQGMLGMAWLSRLITGWAPQSLLRRFDARFLGITHLGNAMRCTGRVIEKLDHLGESCVRIELQCTNQFGQTKIIGEAIVALP